MDALDRAVEIAGSQQALAALLGGGPTRISQMKRRGTVPGDAVIPIAKAVEFRVTPHELNPDLYPHPEDGLPPELRAAQQQAAE